MTILNCSKCKRGLRDPKAHHITRIKDGKVKFDCTLNGDKPDLAMQVYDLMLIKGDEKADKVRAAVQALLDAEKSAHEQTVIDRNSYAAGKVTEAERLAEERLKAALAPLQEKIGLLERTNAELSGKLGGFETELRSAVDARATAEARAATAEASAKDAEAKYGRLAAGALAKDNVLGEKDSEIKALKAQIAALQAGTPTETEMTMPTDEDDAGNPPTTTAPVQAAAAPAPHHDGAGPAAKPQAEIVDDDGDAEDEDDVPATEIGDDDVEEASDDADEAVEAKTAAPAETPAAGNGAELCLVCQKQHVARTAKLPLTSGNDVDAGICKSDECRKALYEQTFGQNLVELDRLPVKVEDDFDFARLFTPITAASATATTN